MKKILISLMTIALVAVMAVGGAFAFFYDTEASTGNTFTAGTLVLSVAGSEGGSAGWITPNNWAPGETETGHVDLPHAGTIDAAMRLQIDSIEVTGGFANIAPDVIVTVMTFGGEDILPEVRTALIAGEELRLHELDGLYNFVLDAGTFSPGLIGQLLMTFTYCTGATEQGASASMVINFSLNQTGP